MKQILEQIDPFRLIQTHLDDSENCPIESIMSLGNAYMGARGNYEEYYSGNTLKGTYIAGVWLPDKTRVGWWKNGYPRYYGKVINAPDFLTFDLLVDGCRIDLASTPIDNFQRVVNMKTGIMTRSLILMTNSGRIKIQSERFFSITEKHLACATYTVTSLENKCNIVVKTGIDANVINTDANYGEQFWDVLDISEAKTMYLECRTIENSFGTPCFTVGIGASIKMQSDIGGGLPDSNIRRNADVTPRSVMQCISVDLDAGQSLTLEKTICVYTSRDDEDAALNEVCSSCLSSLPENCYQSLRTAQADAWKDRWKHSDVVIQGDNAAQQGIRFNLFQLWSTYDGTDERLNIGPKGFTGEKYGGATYYDTEGYCIPMYLATAKNDAARNLLLFRYRTLAKARENAAKIGMKGALYPMVTFDGEECHNEWEITFEELHRNCAIIYAIYYYTRFTGDETYIRDYGLDVMTEICRFWSSRVNYNPRKDCYMILGVTGPNEYDNNINNNFLTNFMVKWCLEFTAEYIEKFNYNISSEELNNFRNIANKMYINYDPDTQIFLQQDGFMDKELLPVSSIPKKELPLCKHWSWDRILRSCFIKQADVVLALYYLPDAFTLEQKQKNFQFYEPMTVHESSLSPSMYSTVASACGFKDKAYELYMRAARLDLDNYNADTEDGLHITCMGGTWISIIHGFAGMNVHGSVLSFHPYCPKQWKSVSFRINYRGRLLSCVISDRDFTCIVLEGEPLTISVNDKLYTINGQYTISLEDE